MALGIMAEQFRLANEATKAQAAKPMEEDTATGSLPAGPPTGTQGVTPAPTGEPPAASQSSAAAQPLIPPTTTTTPTTFNKENHPPDEVSPSPEALAAIREKAAVLKARDSNRTASRSPRRGDADDRAL